MSGDKLNFTVHRDPTYPNGNMLMGHQGDSKLDSGVLGPYVDYEEALEPSAVERLGGLVDPELQVDIDKRDELKRLREGDFQLRTFDFVADPSCPKAVPLE